MGWAYVEGLERSADRGIWVVLATLRWQHDEPKTQKEQEAAARAVSEPFVDVTSVSFVQAKNVGGTIRAYYNVFGKPREDTVTKLDGRRLSF